MSRKWTLTAEASINLPANSGETLRWDSVGHMMYNVFEEMRQDWIRGFVLNDNPIEDVEFLTASHLQNCSAPFRWSVFLDEDPKTTFSEALHVPVLKEKEYSLGVVAMRLDGGGDVEKYHMRKMSCRRYVVNSKKRTMFHVARHDDYVEVTWIALTDNNCLFHLLKLEIDGLNQAFTPDSKSFDTPQLEILVESIQQVNVVVGKSTVETSTPGFISATGCKYPFIIGPLRVHNFYSFDTSINARGEAIIEAGLSNITVKNLRRWAIRSRLLRLEIAPKNTLVINFDFSGVVDEEEQNFPKGVL